MIKYIRFQNFYSFAEEVELSFEIGKQPAPSAYDINTPGGRLNKAISVIGANGSGKSQLIKTLAFLSWFISDSFLGSKPESEIPCHPHALNTEEPSKFELEFIIDEIVYKYKLNLLKGVVNHESLHKKTSHLFSYVFSRDLTEVAIGTGNYKYKQQGFGFHSSKAEQIRHNASLISAAHSYDIGLASHIVCFFEKFTYNSSILGRRDPHIVEVLDSANFFHNNERLHSQMESLICGFDMGVNGISIQERELQQADGTPSKLTIALASHTSPEGNFTLPITQESSGTQSAFVLLSKVLPVLNDGGVAIIDEIDNDLHPFMLPHILELFKFEHTNPYQAQIVFTCHTPEMLNLLKKHQVYLVEKKEQKSEAWRLDEVVGLRADDNLYGKYMAGALSAVPDL